MLIFADLVQNLCSLIFVQGILIFLPYIQMILPQGQKHRNVLFRDHMPFPECRILHHIFHDPRNVMAKHMPHRVHRIDTPHYTLPP